MMINARNTSGRAARQCGRGSLGQYSNTCWLNAPLNALTLTPAIYELIVTKWYGGRLMSEEEARSILFMQQPQDSCPTFQSYINAFVAWRLIHDNTLNVTAENNVGRKLVNTMLPGQDHKQGGLSKIALKPLLEQLLTPESYTIIPFSVYNGNITDAIPQGGKATTVVVRDGTMFSTFFRVPPHTYSFASSNYTLHAAVIGVTIGDPPRATHVIAAFVCNDTQYVYDANLHSIVQADWRDGRLEPYFNIVKSNANAKNKYNTVGKFETLIYLKSDLKAMQPLPQPPVAMQPQQASQQRAASNATPRVALNATPRAASNATPRAASNATPRVALNATPRVQPQMAACKYVKPVEHADKELEAILNMCLLTHAVQGLDHGQLIDAGINKFDDKLARVVSTVFPSNTVGYISLKNGVFEDATRNATGNATGNAHILIACKGLLHEIWNARHQMTQQNPPAKYPLDNPHTHSLQAAIIGVGYRAKGVVGKVANIRLIVGGKCNNTWVVYDPIETLFVAVDWPNGNLGEYFKALSNIPGRMPNSLNEFKTLVYTRAT
jgi:hypothetical protein